MRKTTRKKQEYDEAVVDSERVPLKAAAAMMRTSGSGDSTSSSEDDIHAHVVNARSTGGTNNPSFFAQLSKRTLVLVVLMLFQSVSSSVLAAYSDLLADHVIITLFLTMLVGAGGNAGNQSAVNVIRGLATGAVTPANAMTLVFRETLGGIAMGMCLVAIACGRILWMHPNAFNEGQYSGIAIVISLFLIVVISVFLGSVLPLIIHYGLHMDAAHAGPTIQVVMDILGVLITCTVCFFFLNNTPGTIEHVHPHSKI